jgi:hypothetical protein
MAEKAVTELAQRVKRGEKMNMITDLPQSVYLRPSG